MKLLSELTFLRYSTDDTNQKSIVKMMRKFNGSDLFVP